MSSLTGTEAEVLREMLYFQRWEILRLINGLQAADAHWRPHPDANTLIGIVNHLAWVERLWFHAIVGGSPVDAGPAFDVDPGTSPEEVTARYVAALTRSNEILDAAELDETFESDEGRVSLRWIINHMIEETARHAGHGDITRQLIDGWRAT